MSRYFKKEGEWLGILKCLPGYRDTPTGGAILRAEEINTVQPTKQHGEYFIRIKKNLISDIQVPII